MPAPAVTECAEPRAAVTRASERASAGAMGAPWGEGIRRTREVSWRARGDGAASGCDMPLPQ